MATVRLRAVMLRLAPEPVASRQAVLKYFVQCLQVYSTECLAVQVCSTVLWTFESCTVASLPNTFLPGRPCVRCTLPRVCFYTLQQVHLYAPLGCRALSSFPFLCCSGLSTCIMWGRTRCIGSTSFPRTQCQ